MRIVVVGAGGVGGYFGAVLARGGQDVTFVARGAHLAAMQANGLSIESPSGAFAIRPVKATDDPAAIGPVDIVLFAVKLYDMETAAAALKPLVGPGTVVIPLQNGIDAATIVGRAVGAAHVAAGVAYISALVERPGVVRHNALLARLAYGPLEASQQAPLAAFKAACDAAGLDTTLTDDPRRVVWEKFLFLASMSGMTALTRHSIGPIRTNPATRAMMMESLAETAAVAAALGVRLPGDQPERVLAQMDAMPEAARASMLVDLERGRPLELPWLSGAVARLGSANGVPTPVHRAIVAALALQVDGTTPRG
ncbi:ketopantoate reductase [Stella humosa]|uniref:2-dehydropantoate 2-reductase n=2 Tax=Stella humosa TaxID=94 RepID=A0A3N1L043_9PROT|nr:2-dehydropantoate 2-reductase [Stella humosa]ROP83958.1 ketopantoate reductase [Stella humosa]